MSQKVTVVLKETMAGVLGNDHEQAFVNASVTVAEGVVSIKTRGDIATFPLHNVLAIYAERRT